MSSLIPIMFRCLAAVPGISLNDRRYSREVLESSVPYWPGKPFLLDHDMHDVQGRAIGILSHGIYGLDKTKDGKMVEGLWLHGFGRIEPKLYEKMQSTDKVPAIVKSVSIGGQGEARPGIEASTGRQVTDIIKLIPQELSCISIPGIPSAHVAAMERIEEQFKITDLNVKEMAFPDLTKKMADKEALDKKIDTAGDSITIDNSNKDPGILKLPIPNKKLPTKEFFKSSAFKDLIAGKTMPAPQSLPRPRAIETPMKHIPIVPVQNQSVGRVHRDNPRPIPAEMREPAIRKYNYQTKTFTIDKPLVEQFPQGTIPQLMNPGSQPASVPKGGAGGIGAYKKYLGNPNKVVSPTGMPAAVTQSIVYEPEEYLTQEEEDELDWCYSFPDEEIGQAEQYVASLLYPLTYTPPLPSVFSEAKKWIGKMHLKKGALRKTVGVKPGQKIPVSTLHRLAKQGGVTGKRARLALAFRGMKHKRK